jgi:hypothetical protein
MSENLLGELSKVKLFDLIKPLLVEKKTGLLTIEGSENGEVFLETGNIVHARTGLSIGEEAFMNIMSWETGATSFQPDVPSREKTIFIPTENLLLNWSYKKQEWEKIRKVVPSPHAVFRLSIQNHPEDKNIKGDHWNVLALANGTRTVLEIATLLEWDEFKTSKIICQLLQEGLLERGGEGGTPTKKGVDKGFFQLIESELKNIMGPVATFLIDDKLTEFGETKEAFPKDRVLSFVDMLSEEIPNEKKKKEFRKTMMEFFYQKR